MSQTSYGSNPDAPSASTAKISAIRNILGNSQSRLYSGLQPMHRSRSLNNGGAAYNDPGGTSRVMVTAPFGMHDLCLEIANWTCTGTGELQTGLNPVTAAFAIETASRTYAVALPDTPTFYLNGVAYYTIAPNSQFLSCPLGIDVAASANLWMRTTVRIALPPTQATPATATTGGTITAATHTVAITAVCGPQGESGVSSQTIVTTGSTSTITATWAAPSLLSVPPLFYYVYLDGLLNQIIPAGTLTATLTAPSAAGSKAPPSTGQFYPIGAYVGPNSADTGTGANYVATFGGTGPDLTLSTGTTGLVTNINGYVFSPLGIWGVPNQGYNVPQVFLRGDSVMDGIDNQSATLEQPDRGFVARTIIAAGGKTYTQNGRNGETLAAATAGNSPIRMLRAGAATDTIIHYLSNDLTQNNASVATMQSLILADATNCAERCSRVWVCDILPRTMSSDRFVTTANQICCPVTISGATNATPIVITTQTAHGLNSGMYVRQLNVLGNTAANGSFYINVLSTTTYSLYTDSAYTSSPVAGNGTFAQAAFPLYASAERLNIEANRQAINAWYRAGAPCTVSGGLATAVAVGTAGAITCSVYGTTGQLVQAASGGPAFTNGVLTGHPFSGGVIDSAAVVEVAGPNAGTTVWLPSPSSQYYTGDGTHPGGNITGQLGAAVPTQLMVPA